MKMKLINLKSIRLMAFITASFTIAAIVTGCGNNKQLTLSGTIESTQINCNTEAAGKVIEVLKEEGSMVKEGETIARLDSKLQELAVKQQEELVKAKQAKLDELMAGTRPEQLEQAEAAVQSASLASKNAQTGVDTARTSYNYFKDKYDNVKALYNSKSASENDLSDAKYKLDTAKQQLDIAQKQLESSKSQLQSVKAQLELLKNGSTSQTIKAAQADLEQSKILLEQAKVILSRFDIKATVDGTVLTRSIEPGDIVNIGTNAATISNLSKLWISIYIPQKYLSAINPGQELELSIPGLGGKKAHGSITYISNKAEYTPKNVETNEAKEDTVFKVKIGITDNLESLKPGMTATVNIMTGE